MQELIDNLKDAARYLLQNGQTKQGLAVQACVTMLEDDSEDGSTEREKTLALLVKRLCRRLAPDDMLREGATEYLRREGLLGSPLRATDAGVTEVPTRFTDDDLVRFYEQWLFNEEDPGEAEFIRLVREVERRVMARTPGVPASHDPNQKGGA